MNDGILGWPQRTSQIVRVQGAPVDSLTCPVPNVEDAEELHIAGLVQATGAAQQLQMRFNGDAGLNYHWNYVVGLDAAAGAGESAAAVGLAFIGQGGNTNASTYSAFSIDVPFHRDRVEKSFSGTSYNPNTLATQQLTLGIGGIWRREEPIVSVTIMAATNQIGVGSRLRCSVR